MHLYRAYKPKNYLPVVTCSCVKAYACIDMNYDNPVNKRGDIVRFYLKGNPLRGHFLSRRVLVCSTCYSKTRVLSCIYLSRRHPSYRTLWTDCLLNKNELVRAHHDWCYDSCHSRTMVTLKSLRNNCVAVLVCCMPFLCKVKRAGTPLRN